MNLNKYLATPSQVDLKQLEADFRMLVESLDPAGHWRLEGPRHVRRPVNFVTYKVQPRKRNLAVTVYGRPDTLSPCGVIQLKLDRTPYSIFRLNNWVAKDEIKGVLARALSNCLRT